MQTDTIQTGSIASIEWWMQAELLQLLAAVTKLGFLRRYSRRVLARALGLPLPKSDVKIKGLPTCSVGPTADMLRGSLLTPTDIPPPYPVVTCPTVECIHFGSMPPTQQQMHTHV